MFLLTFSFVTFCEKKVLIQQQKMALRGPCYKFARLQPFEPKKTLAILKMFPNKKEYTEPQLQQPCSQWKAVSIYLNVLQNESLSSDWFGVCLPCVRSLHNLITWNWSFETKCCPNDNAANSKLCLNPEVSHPWPRVQIVCLSFTSHSLFRGRVTFFGCIKKLVNLVFDNFVRFTANNQTCCAANLWMQTRQEQPKPGRKSSLVKRMWQASIICIGNLTRFALINLWLIK